MSKITLPIDSYLNEALALLAECKNLIVRAEPGAGKTTRLPPELLKITDKAIWVLEPRRIAAISASQRIAEENGWPLGGQVGYQVRFENKSSRETRLLFLTEALLMRKLLQDPELKDVGCVVLDEFHERSLHVDLALAALKELQELSRPDLKIVVMSATLDTAPLARYLEKPAVLDVPGKVFPLEVHLDSKQQSLRTDFDFIERMRKLIQKACVENKDGDILCFLPGKGEIERTGEALATWADGAGIKIFALHGSLKLEEQKAALIAIPGVRKIILATNVAESSLTVQGVRIVVDSGLQRLSSVNQRTGLESLELTRIARASATQRAGRAARLGPGTAYRAWTKHDEAAMRDFDLPEVQRSDLADSLLLLAALGIGNFAGFSWFEPPPGRALQQARDFLIDLGAIDAGGQLTKLGEELRQFPVHPRIGRMLLTGRQMQIPNFACELAALLSEKGSSNAGTGETGENDLILQWSRWRSAPDQARNRNLSRAAQHLKDLVRSPAGDRKVDPYNDSAEVLLGAYSDRLCRRRRPHEPQAKMAGGRGVKLHPNSSVKTSGYFIALDLADGRDSSETMVFQAVGIPDSLIEKHIAGQAKKETHLEWDKETDRFVITEGSQWRGIAIGREHTRPANAQEVEGHLAPLALENWDAWTQKNEELSAWLARLRHLNQYDSKWPQLNEEQKLNGLEQAFFGESSFNSAAKKDLIPYFENQLSGEQRRALNDLCPSHWTAPTGTSLRVQYSAEQGPSIEVRLQELFGLAEAPKVCGRNMTLVLLAPNYRPTQVTRDLASFWRNGYPEVRKEMRSRYPKHSWPEDPLTAPPQRGPKRRK